MIRLGDVGIRYRHAVLLSIACIAVVLSSCRKVPLEQSVGRVDVAIAHWFETEGVAYVFFSLADRPDLLERGVWQLAYVQQTADGGTVASDFSPIDYSSGVHFHSLQTCSGGRICGSYSFATDLPLQSAQLRFLYDAENPLGITVDASVQNHTVSDTAAAYSGQGYAVFDSTNQAVQIRIQNNFGSPAHADVAEYGMTRRFRVTDTALFDADLDTVAERREATSSNFAFPATFCPDPADAAPFDFSGIEAWYPTLLDRSAGERGVCYQLDFLDKNGVELTSGASFGLRNPELTPAIYNYATPLADVRQIPIVLRYCADDPFAGQVFDQEFYDYQRFIMGMSGQGADLCFTVGGEDDFRTALEALLATELQAELEASIDNTDVIFTVVLHHIVSDEFRQFHQITVESLNSMVQEQLERVSPRLVGAMVYEADTFFRPTATQRSNVMWCPQDLPDDLADLDDPSLAIQSNCTNLQAQELDLRVINFVSPLGPFPSYENYTDYVEEYGDKGLAGNPSLVFRSAATTASTRFEEGERITFFDGERLAFAANEAMRFCPLRENFSFFFLLRFRETGTPDSVASLEWSEFDALARFIDEPTEFLVGVQWELPFWGAISYSSTLTGNILSAIPFQYSSRNRESLGDFTWTIDTWPIGDYIEYCRRFCNHPVFDSQGVYQPSVPWNEQPPDACPDAQIPVPPDSLLALRAIGGQP